MNSIRTVCMSTTAIFLLMACGGGGSSAPAPVTPPPSGGGGSTGGGSTGPVTQSNIEYASASTTNGNIPLLLDIYQPSDTCDANRPTVFFVHGGGFVSGSKTGSGVDVRSAAALEKDFNFVSINYRLADDNPVLAPEYQVIADQFIAASQASGPDADIIVAAVAAMEDSIAALNWMDNNASQYCLDMSRLAYWGSSAGAFTVLNVAYTADEYSLSRPDPDVVINYWGDLPIDSSLEFMEAPFLTVHGDADTVVPYQGALDLAAQADAVGVPYSFYTHVGGGHGVSTDRTVNGVTLMVLTMNFIEAHIVGGTPLYETANVD